MERQTVLFPTFRLRRRQIHEREMAGIDVLCSNKTGTLSKNQLTLGDPVLFGAGDAQECILAGALASKAEDKDAIDLTVIGGLQDDSAMNRYEQVSFTPFDPISKRTEATVRDREGRTIRCTKGAPQVILSLAEVDGTTRQRAEQIVSDMAAKGYRTLGVARAEGDGQWQYLGILPMYDPPRDDSAETIAQARAHGIDVKMVTGDNLAIGREISSQLGMGVHLQPASQPFVEGSDPSRLTDEQARRVEKADGFAEVFPSTSMRSSRRCRSEATWWP